MSNLNCQGICQDSVTYTFLLNPQPTPVRGRDPGVGINIYYDIMSHYTYLSTAKYYFQCQEQKGCYEHCSVKSNIYCCIVSKCDAVPKQTHEWYDGEFECQIAMTVS